MRVLFRDQAIMSRAAGLGRRFGATIRGPVLWLTVCGGLLVAYTEFTRPGVGPRVEGPACAFNRISRKKSELALSEELSAWIAMRLFPARK